MAKRRFPAPALDPGATLIARERQIWTLEGMLVEDADPALRSSDAKKTLGDPATLAASADGEARLRAYLRSKRSADLTAAGQKLVSELDDPSQALLEQQALDAGEQPTDVFLEYLTYDGLNDLALLRLGYARYQAGRYASDTQAQAIAASFFSGMKEAPSADEGINVVFVDDHSIVLDVFGARVEEKTLRSQVEYSGAVGAMGAVDWTSNYEALRGLIRGEDPQTAYHEELECEDGEFTIDYADELQEYVSWNAQSPWATVLYSLPADQVADLYAGMAAAAGVDAKPLPPELAADELPVEGTFGTTESGLTVRVSNVVGRTELGGRTPKHGQFLLVTLDVASTLDRDLHAPPEWFTLATSAGQYNEAAVSTPGLGLAILPFAPAGTHVLGLPFTLLPAHAHTTLLLVFDVPGDTKTASLFLGAQEMGLKVAVQ
jgi:hypothetical protein